MLHDSSTGDQWFQEPVAQVTIAQHQTLFARGSPDSPRFIREFWQHEPRSASGRFEIFARLSSRRTRVNIHHASATERALIENSERYRSLFAYNPHAAFSLDLEGRFIDTNAVAVELSGYSQAELRSMHFIDVVCEEEIPGSRRPSKRS